MGLFRKRPDADLDVRQDIGYLCAHSEADYSLFLDLADRITSPAVAHAAVKALRAELTKGSPTARIQAVRLWAVLMANSVATHSEFSSPKWLDCVETVTMNRSSPPDLVSRIQRVWADLAFTHEGSAITSRWDDLFPHAAGGIPASSEDAVINMLSPELANISKMEQQYPHLKQQQGDIDLKTSTDDLKQLHQPEYTAVARHHVSPPPVQTLQDDIAVLHKLCDAGVGLAASLNSKLGAPGPQNLTDPIILVSFAVTSSGHLLTFGETLYRDCIERQEMIESNLAWANSQADSSRRSREENLELIQSPPTESVEEALLIHLLMASSKLGDVIQAYDEQCAIALEAEQMEAVQNASLLDHAGAEAALMIMEREEQENEELEMPHHPVEANKSVAFDFVPQALLLARARDADPKLRDTPPPLPSPVESFHAPAIPTEKKLGKQRETWFSPPTHGNVAPTFAPPPMQSLDDEITDLSPRLQTIAVSHEADSPVSDSTAMDESMDHDSTINRSDTFGRLVDVGADSGNESIHTVGPVHAISSPPSYPTDERR